MFGVQHNFRGSDLVRRRSGCIFGMDGTTWEPCADISMGSCRHLAIQKADSGLESLDPAGDFRIFG
ncbi:hypothetical protein CDZ96_07980 [Mameliella alba]|nr:hypothetical protein CDZ96_07980 [Mameliella alba]